MGFRVLLIAVTGKEPAVIHREYGVAATDRYEEIPASPVTGAMLPSGAYLLYINDEIVPDDLVFAPLSRNASLITCYANETAMNSFASAWRNGIEEWSVFHDDHVKHLETTGELPDVMDGIQKRLFARQDSDSSVDYVFDIPIELFVSLGGIRYDSYIAGAGPRPWQVLARF
jgi:hypothetical protein